MKTLSAILLTAAVGGTCAFHYLVEGPVSPEEVIRVAVTMAAKGDDASIALGRVGRAAILLDQGRRRAALHELEILEGETDDPELLEAARAYRAAIERKDLFPALPLVSRLRSRGGGGPPPAEEVAGL